MAGGTVAVSAAGALGCGVVASKIVPNDHA